VGVNLLLLWIGASEKKEDFVSFLFKTSPRCGGGWKSREFGKLCTNIEAENGRFFELKTALLSRGAI
jgi:hypothetical protein